MSAYPPALAPAQLAQLSHDARDFALSRGLAYRPLPRAGAAPPQSSAIHAPLALLPTPWPREAYAHAQRLMPLYSELYARVAADGDWLEATLRLAVRGDAFAEALWRVWQEYGRTNEQLQLGLFRSDYLLHAPAGSSGVPQLRQVEFNTISSSFGALSGRVSELHAHFLRTHPQLFPAGAETAPNAPLTSLAGGLSAAHEAYLKARSVADARVLFVVQDGERNAFDQRAIEWELSERYHIRVHRATFAALRASAVVSPAGELQLLDPLDNSPFAVSVVYFRAGYGPDDYKDQSDWDTRALLERSAAIKCPSIALQLAGAKRVQQALAAPGVLERFLLDPARGEALSATAVDALRASFMGMWPLDNSDEGREGTRLAEEEAYRFVLKPMREGGGNNVYRGDIPGALAQMRARDAAAGPGADEKQTYILMELIDVPPSTGAYLLRAPPAGTCDPAPEAAAVRAEDTVSELGTYGYALFSARGGRVEDLRMHSEGHLLRTKARESDEGGVAVGFSVLDSPLLV